jgi:hypothetical protein
MTIPDTHAHAQTYKTLDKVNETKRLNKTGFLSDDKYEINFQQNDQRMIARNQSSSPFVRHLVCFDGLIRAVTGDVTRLLTSMIISDKHFRDTGNRLWPEQLGRNREKHDLSDHSYSISALDYSL